MDNISFEKWDSLTQPKLRRTENQSNMDFYATKPSLVREMS